MKFFYKFYIKERYYFIYLTLYLIFIKCNEGNNAAKFVFNATSCDTMEPFYMTEESVKTTTEVSATNTSSLDESTPEMVQVQIPKLELITDAIFRVKLNETMYRRNRVIQIDMEALSEDVTIEGYAIQILQVSDSDDEEEQPAPKRIGSFTADPKKQEMTQKCDGNQDSNDFLHTGPKFTSNSLKRKNMTTIYWTAPDDPSGHLVADASIMMSDMKYWRGKSDQQMTFNEFPPSRKKCGFEKSCVRIGKPEKTGCSPDNCNYFLTWQLVDDNRTVDFVLGGKLAINQYMGIGFLNASGMYPNNMTLLSCNRLAENGGEIKSYFIVDKKSPLNEINSEFRNSMVDPDGTEKQWCKFSRPFLPPVPEDSTIPPLDFSENFTLVYIIGKLNDSKPIIPENLKFGGSEGALSIMEPIMVTNVIDISLSSTAPTIKFTIISLFLPVLRFPHYMAKNIL